MICKIKSQFKSYLNLLGQVENNFIRSHSNFTKNVFTAETDVEKKEMGQDGSLTIRELMADLEVSSFKETASYKLLY